MLRDKLHTNTKTTKIHFLGRLSPNDVLYSCFEGIY